MIGQRLRLILCSGGTQAIAAFLMICVATISQAGTTEQKTMLKKEIKLEGTILSPPALVRGSTENWVAFVRGEIVMSRGLLGRKTDRYFGVDAYSDDGKHIRSFPILWNDGDSSPYLIAPGHQLAQTDVRSSSPSGFLVVDLEGHFSSYDSQGKIIQQSPASPERGLLVWPPTPIEDESNRHKGWILISADYGPYFQSKNQIDVLDTQGRSFPGFPLPINGFPEQHSPIFDKLNHRLYILVKTTGEVDGFDLAAGKRLEGFPAKLPWTDDTVTPKNMAYYPPWNSLVVSSGTSKLMKVDGTTGKAVEFAMKDARQLSSISTLDDQLAVLDDEKRQISLLDKRGQITASLSLDWEMFRKSYFMKLVKTSEGSSPYLLVFSSRRVDSLTEIERLYEKYKTTESDKEIETFYRDYANTYYGTSDFEKLSTKQQNELRREIVDSKQGYVEEWIGVDRRIKEMDMSTQTGFDLIQVSDSGLHLMYSDVTEDYWADTGISLSPMVFPATIFDSNSKTLRVALPLNFYDQAGDTNEAKRKSCLSLYQIALH
ncbi:MAG: hypothetical protein V1706_07895 [Pseudomonadota bacterium]